MSADLANRKLRLGDILVEQNIITNAQLEEALKTGKDTGQRLGHTLVESGFTSEQEIARALHLQLGIAQIDLRGLVIPDNVLALIPSDVLRKYGVFPIGFRPDNADTLIIAVSDPLDTNIQDNIAIITGCRIEVKLAAESNIRAAIDRHFGTDEATQAAEQYMRERGEQLAAAVGAGTEDLEVSEAPMVALVRSIVEQAVRGRASDIHFDALEKQVRVRYRVDGVLTDKMLYDLSLLPAIVTRVKILAGMDISEKRKPQDGRMVMPVDGKDYDIRVSALPSLYGEKLVLRIAMTGGLTRSMNELGFSASELAQFKHILKNPNGIILVTGPTGSGKSTTLYTALAALNSREVNIITIEDPIEVSVPGINQVQVNNKADLTFASSLRAILRQDPDVIMIGEIRDLETAGLAVQAAVTGHLVLSTLHTNSVLASITRLTDMGVDAYLLSDAVAGVVAQRLVRKLCTHCREVYRPDERERQILGLSPTDTTMLIYRAKGCPVCENTGYFGRIGVYEILSVSAELKRLIAARAPADQLMQTALKNGLETLHHSAARHVLAGTTSVSELLRVAFVD